jgi:hypothetical protein
MPIMTLCQSVVSRCLSKRFSQRICNNNKKKLIPPCSYYMFYLFDVFHVINVLH